MSITFRPAVRENVPLLIGLSAGTGGGKTFSALRLARGIAGGKPIVGIDTENGRMLHYADAFPELLYARLDAPFRPERYAEAIKAADKTGAAVIVVDSMSHEWAGDGGVLEWQEEEYQRLGARDAIKMLSWSAPKQGHKRFVYELLQVKAHVILCFRAEPKVEMVKRNGRTEVVPKQSLTSLDGWTSLTGKELPFELTTSFLLMADKPGVPRPIKLPEPLKAFVPLDQPLTEETGRLLGVWAAGSSAGEKGAVSQAASTSGDVGASPAPSDVAGEPSAGASSVSAAAGSGEPPSPAQTSFTPPTEKPASKAKRDELGDLVSELTKAEKPDGSPCLTLEQLYKAAGVEPVHGVHVDNRGKLRWPPLRDSLTGGQADELIDRLDRYKANIASVA